MRAIMNLFALINRSGGEKLDAVIAVRDEDVVEKDSRIE